MQVLPLQDGAVKALHSAETHIFAIIIVLQGKAGSVGAGGWRVRSTPRLDLCHSCIELYFLSYNSKH